MMIVVHEALFADVGMRHLLALTLTCHVRDSDVIYNNKYVMSDANIALEYSSIIMYYSKDIRSIHKSNNAMIMTLDCVYD